MDVTGEEDASSSSEEPPPGVPLTLLSARQAARAVAAARRRATGDSTNISAYNVEDFAMVVRALRRPRPFDVLVTLRAALVRPQGELLLWVRLRFVAPGVQAGLAAGLHGLIVKVQVSVSERVLRVVSFGSVGP